MKAPDPRRRSRSNDGTPSHTQTVLPIDRGLRAKLEACAPAVPRPEGGGRGGPCGGALSAGANT